MDLHLFWRGLVIGFSIAAPVGPIGVLCIRRTLANGRLLGLASGLGAATADAVYGVIAGLGLAAVSQLLVEQRHWLQWAGGAFLLYLGVRTFLSRPTSEPANAGGQGLLAGYLSTLALTLTNPMTILSFAAVFSGLGLAGGAGGYAGTVVLVGGVFTGSALWWLLLSGGVSVLRARFSLGALGWVNRLSGAVIVGFGLIALLSG